MFQKIKQISQHNFLGIFFPFRWLFLLTKLDISQLGWQNSLHSQKSYEWIFFEKKDQ